MNTDDIPRLADIPSYAAFLESYLMPNIPVILGPALVKDWPALRLWTRAAADGSRAIDWTYLAEHYGLCEVSVADCGASDAYGNMDCEPALFGSVVAKWEQGQGQALYAKDWHLPRTVEASDESSSPPARPQDGSPVTKKTPGQNSRAFYSTPDIFRDDWMNAYYTAFTSDDFRFVYCGAEGTFTPLHRDVYCSYSWSTNVCGRKRWWLYPPEDTKYLFMEERRISVHDVRCVDEVRFPNFGKARPLMLIQEEGETIFVPSGWYHQVENLTACISINHNWCNSVNLLQLYKSMCDEIVEVEKALYDVRDMLRDLHGDGATWKKEFTKVVQDVVQKDAGWNWLTFWNMVLYALSSAVASEHLGVQVLPDSETLSHPERRATQPIFTPASSELRPTLTFIADNVKECCENFVSRERHECGEEVEEVVNKIQSILHILDAQVR